MEECKPSRSGLLEVLHLSVFFPPTLAVILGLVELINQTNYICRFFFFLLSAMVQTRGDGERVGVKYKNRSSRQILF